MAADRLAPTKRIPARLVGLTALGLTALMVIGFVLTLGLRGNSVGGLSATERMAIVSYFEGLGDDEMGRILKQQTCSDIFVGFSSPGVDPETFWDGIAIQTQAPQISPREVRQALSGLCAQFVDTSYQGNVADASNK